MNCKKIKYIGKKIRHVEKIRELANNDTDKKLVRVLFDYFREKLFNLMYPQPKEL